MPQRANLSFQLSNPLTAVDLLLHGEDKLHGWGQSVPPDQNLFFVRGYDAEKQRFVYDVNKRFGATSPQQSAIRAPVTLTALLRFDVGPTRERQMLTQFLDRGRTTKGNKMTEPMIKGLYGGAGIVNPMAQLLRQADTLHLSQVQADSIAALNRWYTIRLDSLWSPVAKYLAELPDNYDQGVAYDRYRETRRAAVDLLIRIVPTIKSLLTADQSRQLPPFISSSLDTRYLASIRSGTAGMGGPGVMMMGGGMMMGEGLMTMDVMKAGVEGAVIQIRRP
jgi:hypothetical protein